MKSTVNRCDNELCTYQKDAACLLESVQINMLGYCEGFVLVDIPTETLELLKCKWRDETVRP